ncbi:MAG: GTP-sensing pleiotropic transcriptional regulator CodY [Bacillota bacterium]
MSKLLEKSRQIHHLLQTGSMVVEFSEMAEVLKTTINSNVYIVNPEGKILGFSLLNEFDCEIIEDKILEDDHFPEEYNNYLLRTADIKRNITNEENNCLFIDNQKCIYENKITTIVPIFGGGDRLGTLVLARYNDEFQDEDLFLAEYGASVIGMEIMRNKNEEMEKEIRKKAEVQIAIDTLSYSEMEAIQSIFEELDGKEGLLVASKIADKIGITRSVIVNALRKLESSGVIESRSLGMKGTHIRVLNDYLLDEIDKVS